MRANPKSGLLPAVLLAFAALAGAARAQDTAPPAAITDLAAAGGSGSATLTFTAPKDTGTGSTGNATAYDIRYSTVSISDANWINAIPAANVGTPQAAGKKETVTVTGLVPLQHYYFATKSTDAAMNTSQLSNVADAATSATASPLPDVKVGQPGITGYYYQLGMSYNNSKLAPDRADAFSSTNFVNVKTDDQIAYDGGDPDNGMVGPPAFAIRWVGQLKVPKDGSWVISVRPNAGMRVWLSETTIDVNNPNPAALICDGWYGGPSVVDSLPLTLSASKSYNLLVESYFLGSGKAHLQWTGPGTGDHDDVPMSALTTGSVAAPAAGGRVNGTVLDSSGAPVFDNQVTLTGGGAPYTATTDANGFYSLYLQPGSYTVAGGSPVATNYSHLPASPIAVTAGAITAVPAITGDIPLFIESATASPYDDEFPGTKLDPKWSNVDLGDSMGGGAAANNGTLLATAGGSDINGTADGENFTYQKITGNFAATLEVITIPNNQDWEMGGLDIRATPDANSAHAFFQTQMNHAMQHKIRATKGSDSAEYDLADSTAGMLVFPVYVKIRRVDDMVAFYWTKDPVKGPVNPAFVLRVPGFKGVQDLVAGIAACSHGSVTDPGFTYAHFKVAPIAAVTPPAALLGDLNGDGKVDLKDATLSLQVAVGLLNTLTDAQKIAADANKDGKWDLKDTTLILEAAVGLVKLQ